VSSVCKNERAVKDWDNQFCIKKNVPKAAVVITFDDILKTTRNNKREDEVWPEIDEGSRSSSKVK